MENDGKWNGLLRPTFRSKRLRGVPVATSSTFDGAKPGSELDALAVSAIVLVYLITSTRSRQFVPQSKHRQARCHHTEANVASLFCSPVISESNARARTGMRTIARIPGFALLACRRFRPFFLARKHRPSALS